MSSPLPTIVEQHRFRSPAVTPQALTWHEGNLWLGSRDLRHIYGIEVQGWRVFEQREAPGIPWAAVSVGPEMKFTVGEGPNDDRYMWSFKPGQGFSNTGRFAYPEFTGSYLSYDGANVYLSQWYKGRIMKLGPKGEILRTIEADGEISGHVFVDGCIYVLHGTEQSGESWKIARLNPTQQRPEIQDIATMTFACRSLTHDGRHFWSNYRAGDEIISFSLPS
jgi:hypothetical protein